MKPINNEKEMTNIINDIHKEKNPIILAMIWQPGSGKTYFVSKLEPLLKEDGYQVDKIKVHNNYIKPLYENPTLIKEILSSTKDIKKTNEILQKIRLQKNNIISNFWPNFNLPWAFEAEKFVEDLNNLSKGNSLLIKEYSPWDRVCTKETLIIPSDKKVVMVEWPMAVIPESEYEFCNINNEQIEFKNVIISNSSIYDLIFSVKADILTRVLRRFRRCLKCPKKENCHDNTPLSSFEFHEQRERNWLSFVERKVKDKIFFLTNTLTEDEVAIMDFSKSNMQNEIVFVPKEKGLSWNISLKFDINNKVNVTINIVSPFDNSKRCQSFSLGNVNKEKIIEAMEKYFERS